jgi:hypothetical protein
MKPTVKLIFILLALVGICSCERQNTNLGPLSATVSSDMVCHNGEPLKSGDPLPESSCIRYSYDGDSLLTLAHLNASFNCCPEKFLVDIEVKGDSLIIREENAKLGCKCNCIYNLDILVHNLPADTYHVRFVEPNVHGDKPQLVFDLDLKKKPEGEVCVTRGEGWWR